MGKGRLEAFSDGVLAIIITIMVLELAVPHGSELIDLQPLIPVFLSYVLSFLYVAIYWNNRHHMLHTVKHVSAGILWANLHLLFWLSLFPFATAWMGEHHKAPMPSVVYGVVLLMAAFAYSLLERMIICSHGKDSTLARALGTDWKGKLSPLCYAAAIPLAFVDTWISSALFTIPALWWFIPDRRIERTLAATRED